MLSIERVAIATSEALISSYSGILQVFTGNVQDRNEPVGNTIEPPITTRFIQIRVKTSRGHPSLRAEFYGCTKGKLMS